MASDNKNDLDRLIREFCIRAQSYGCDAVQLLLSVHDSKTQVTTSKQYGLGNWYARVGLANEFIDEGRTRVEEYIKVTEFGEEEDDY